jgi:murein L,D-transpeptidase YcbB/YkuD
MVVSKARCKGLGRDRVAGGNWGKGFASFLLAAALALPPAAGLAQAGQPAAPYAQAVAVALTEDALLADFYRARDYATLWTGAEDAARRAALFSAFDGAAAHGLPIARYDAASLRAAFAAAVTEGDRGRLEVRMTRAFLDYASDVATGVLVPEEADAAIHREVTRLDHHGLTADGRRHGRYAGRTQHQARRAAEIHHRGDGAGTLDARRPYAHAHIWVNLPDFTAKIVDHGKVTF